ncbi:MULTISPECIES: methylated-DNA--[protein]-cysteine S-methyltransferase [Shewanella]|uniref:Methylated-DNA--protein-cysteine methyltransferase n=1 Tax=Shewanella fidelis TaxID=173509 RepID=A0AAW8NNR8_9GAMM|nr:MULTISPECIES: methylated-DNA--[protein]-cysteine S-methyltransferase [Shewanella]MDR8524371.1 methylated-DNA--[protein]-cysteine S-methyltransferase [Shewanella fidelis]MDW4813420.1 methylated-DNA--[protein]-cysteine S-methyltransferase [Shewanella fidelis]MDW4817657.1 methylated-DNA--[protein]-cysteine S-methyltransferase [Shewanella fidelis]MDW4821724.1 methylated-DNA--[protein]-cysteine S-methyltransferase [Shewanella fidelis]MDW4825889.1 methylated-DNA--[protein]-cysteine S-methyltransf
MSKFNPTAKLNFQTSFGHISLCANAQGLTHLSFIPSAEDEWQSREIDNQQIIDNRDVILDKQDVVVAEKHLAQAQQELIEYFAQQRQHFEVPLAPKGTEFQKQVWQALGELGHGQSCSYGDIANKIDRPKAVRAVGTANGANPIAIIVPCHRVIGKNGTLTGYAYGLALKQKLLKLEGLSL